ncbi:MAG TPA: AraC family transcriptional regulator [Burkholderiaceae bacterium]|jgi:AraC-like DNA-binding protein
MTRHNETSAEALGPSRVKGWRTAGVLLELHTGEPTALPPHSHSAYQIGITTREPGEYVCRGRVWHAPRGSIIIFPPDEVHSVGQVGGRHTGDASRLMYVEPQRLLEIARAVAGPEASMPSFDELVITDAAFIGAFEAMHALCGTDAPEAQKQASLRAVLGELVARFGAPAALDRRRERLRARVLAARDFIVSNYRENISLAQLAGLAHSSPYHFNRLFARHVGMPPHAFQNQVRVERSKALILEGTSIAQVAMQTGFFDQSHFTRYFRRIVGVTPSSYALARR